MKKAKNKNTKWTDEEDARLLEMRNNGADFSEIARKLGRTTEGIKGRWKKFNRRVLIKDDDVLAEKVRSLSDDGLTEREICEDMGITHGTLVYVKKSFGIKSAITKMRERESSRANTICWVCKNAMVNCTKPVDGFTATLKRYGEYDPPRWSYMVKECPNFDPEPYAPQNGGRIK